MKCAVLSDHIVSFSCLDLINGAQEQCELPPMDGFPHCEGKIKVRLNYYCISPFLKGVNDRQYFLGEP